MARKGHWRIDDISYVGQNGTYRGIFETPATNASRFRGIPMNWHRRLGWRKLSWRTMRINAVLMIVGSMLLTACATAQKGSLLQANRALADQDHAECLRILYRAESYGEHSAAASAQLSFLKGMCLEGLGRKAEAYAIYRGVIARYPDSDWAAQAKGRLDSAARPY